LLGAKGPFEVSKQAFCSKQTGRLLTANEAFFRVKRRVEKDLKMKLSEYQQDRKWAIFSIFEDELEVGDFRAILTKRFVRKFQNNICARVRNASQIFW
jgi:hypothetical protein